MKAPTPKSYRSSSAANVRSSSYHQRGGAKGEPANMDLHHLELHCADNGVIVKHVMHDPAAEYSVPKEGEQHVFGHDEHKAMLRHVGETLKEYSAHEIDGQ